VRRSSVLVLALVVIFASAACIAPSSEATYAVNASGFLELHTPAPPVLSETVLEKNGSCTLSRIVYQSVHEEVYALLAAPDTPSAALILAPGAGVKKESHLETAETYARAGYACMVIDIRGNGGETNGYPFDIQEDFRRFSRREWPEYYAIVSDLLAARKILSDRFPVPVYIMGESNGGRYAAIAAATDQDFAGYIGVSTSGFGLVGEEYTGDARRFLQSIDPDHAVAAISPRPVFIFHSMADSIIPYDDARAMHDRAQEPKTFITFSGGHGIDGEVNRRVIDECNSRHGVIGS
jgi:uncharacterized protein